MASDILTKLYWTDGSCESGDKDLGSMGEIKYAAFPKVIRMVIWVLHT